MVSDSIIPFKLILEILSRLPAKSVARFSCVSKLWASELSLTWPSSLAQPRLFFTIEEKGLCSFFSLPQQQNQYEKSSSLVVSTELHRKFPPDNMTIFPRSDQRYSCGYASRLFYFYGMKIKEENYYGLPVICNPMTGRYAPLPFPFMPRKAFSFFGFDPIDKQYKVLFMVCPSRPDNHKILTFGSGRMFWRNMICSLRHEIKSEGICINGVIYYLGETCETREDMDASVIVCFDVRSEKFSFIYPESFCQLINYKGKLGVVYYDDHADDAIEFRVWVLEDVEKEEWSKSDYTLRDDQFLAHSVSVVGVTALGDFVLSMAEYTPKQPFYVFYFNPEKNTLQRIEVQGFGKYHDAINNPSRVHVFVDDCRSFYDFEAYEKEEEKKKLNYEAAYGTPYGASYGSPYGAAYGGPYGAASWSAYGRPYSGLYGAAYGGPYGAAYGGPYGATYGGLYGAAYGGPYGASYGGLYGATYGGAAYCSAYETPYEGEYGADY